jgi:hypothetical protein
MSIETGLGSLGAVRRLVEVLCDVARVDASADFDCFACLAMRILASLMPVRLLAPDLLTIGY